MRARQLTRHCCSFILWLSVVSPTTLLGGPQAKPEVKPGILSGRVFLITEAGDIKPARMADVYLLYKYGGVDLPETDDYKTSVENEWMEEYGKALKEAIDEYGKASEVYRTALKEGREGRKPTSPFSCPGNLIVYNSAHLKMLDWVSANKKMWQLIIGQADEEGAFRISVPHSGKYKLIVTGHAGFNTAIWDSDLDDIIISPGEETTVKMSSPKVACVETGN